MPFSLHPLAGLSAAAATMGALGRIIVLAWQALMPANHSTPLALQCSQQRKHIKAQCGHSCQSMFNLPDSDCGHSCWLPTIRQPTGG